MRTSDIWQAAQTPASSRTNELYLTDTHPVEEMSLEELKHFLCGKANGDVLVCENCETKCKFGKRIAELLKPVDPEQPLKLLEEPSRSPEVSPVDKPKQSVKRVHGNTQKARTKYFSAIASRDPERWFEENGHNVGWGMHIIRNEYADVTAQEAQDCLTANGVNPEPAETESCREAEKMELIAELPFERPDTASVHLSKSQCKNVAEFIDRWLFTAIREDSEMDSLNYLRDMLDAEKVLREAAEGEKP